MKQEKSTLTKLAALFVVNSATVAERTLVSVSRKAHSTLGTRSERKTSWLRPQPTTASEHFQHTQFHTQRLVQPIFDAIQRWDRLFILITPRSISPEKNVYDEIRNRLA